MVATGCLGGCLEGTVQDESLNRPFKAAAWAACCNHAVGGMAVLIAAGTAHADCKLHLSLPSSPRPWGGRWLATSSCARRPMEGSTRTVAQRLPWSAHLRACAQARARGAPRRRARPTPLRPKPWSATLITSTVLRAGKDKWRHASPYLAKEADAARVRSLASAQFDCSRFAFAAYYWAQFACQQFCCLLMGAAALSKLAAY